MLRVRLIAPLAHALTSLTPLEDAVAAFPQALEASGFEGGVFFGIVDGKEILHAAHGVASGEDLHDLVTPTLRVLPVAEVGHARARTLGRSWSAVLTTPLVARGERVGHLVLLSKQPIDADHSEIARVLASQLAAVCIAPRTTPPAPVSLTAADLLESMPDLFISFDEKWKILDVNTRAVEMLGRSRRELVGHRMLDLFPALDSTEIMKQCERAMSQRIPIELEYESVLFKGRFFEARIFPAGTGLAAFLRDVTERVTAVRSLEASELRHRAIFEHMLDGLLLTAPDGSILKANPAACEMLGRSEEELIHLRREQIIDTADPRVAVLLAERTRTGRTRGELTFIRRDGTRFEVELCSVVFRDELGRERTSLSFRDVTRRKQAEQKLLEAHDGELHLRRQLEAISNATAAVSESVARLPQSEIGVVLRSVVLQAQLITGARYGAIGIGTDPDKPFDPWVAIGVPRDTARAIGRNPRPRGLFAAVAVEGKSVRIDGMNQASFPPGHPPMRALLGVPLRYRGRAVGNLFLSDKQDGTAFTADDQRAIEILADRVAIALATARLYEAEARERSWLKITIDQMPEAVILGDAQGVVTSWNDAAAKLASDAASREHGMPFDLRKPNGEPLAWEEHPLHRASVRGELVSALELVAVARDGSRIPVLASATPLPRDESGLHGAVAILQDITRHKDVERLREEWTAIVAHDLRQPAALVALAAELLHRRRLGSEDAKLVERIRSGADRLRKMIEDLLDYAQIEAGHLRIAPRLVDVTALISDVVDRVAQAAQGRSVHLVRDGVVRAEVDPDRIDQVVTNLLSNALKYGSSGTDVTVAIVSRPDEIEIAVTNRGAGLSSDELGKLFAKFHRAAGAAGKGIGLGLFITKGIVVAHGGRIWAESTLRETTTFHVVLPILPPQRVSGANDGTPIAS